MKPDASVLAAALCALVVLVVFVVSLWGTP